MISPSNPMWVVCRHKDDNSLFITTRKARETMINVLLDLGQIADSIVLKQCDTYGEAEKFISDQKQSDKDIGGALNNLK